MRRLAGVAAGVLLTAGLAVSAVPAQAQEIYTNICNSTDGNAAIKVWKTNSSYSNWLQPNGECTGGLANGNDQVRVDTTDANSYKIKEIGGSYGPCHTSGNPASNPPNVNNSVYYKTYLFSHSCTGN